MRRYYVAEDWTAKKRDVLVEAPDTLDLESLRAQGLQADEVLLPDDPPAAAAAAAAAAPQPVYTPPPSRLC
jgi:ubiquitin carboxyl-terminal hydrolase 5/13